MEFVKGKPKGTNPAIMGNPMGCRHMQQMASKTINLITRETTSKLREPCTMQKCKNKTKNKLHVVYVKNFQYVTRLTNYSVFIKNDEFFN